MFIRATPEQVWDGITKPEFTARYFYGSVIDSTSSRARRTPAGRGPLEQYVDGEVLESDPPRKLVTTWRALYDPETAAEPHSRVTWEIEPQEGGVTKLTVDARRARGRAEDGRERRRRLELRPQRPEDAARDGRAARASEIPASAPHGGAGPPDFLCYKPGVRAVLLTGFAALLLALPAAGAGLARRRRGSRRRAACT